MPSMFVTLEVSQLEMSALKFFKFLKRELMSVMAETSQSAMGPYFLMAAVESALYSWTAACSSALVVKIAGVKGTENGAEGTTKSTANHCGGTALLSDWRTWAVELGLGEINGLMVLVPSTRPCHSWREV